MKRKYVSHLALVLMFILFWLTFYSSSMPYEDQSLVDMLEKLLPNQPLKAYLSRITFNYAGKPVSIETSSYYYFIEFLIRKGAHFCLYGCFATLFYLILLPYTQPNLVRSLVSLGLSFGLASFDELHQVQTLNRSGMVQDVFLDVAGAISFMLVIQLMRYFYLRYKQKKK